MDEGIRQANSSPHRLLSIDPGTDKSGWCVLTDGAVTESGIDAKFVLGALCRKSHDHMGIGKSLRYKSGGCVLCQAENARARRAVKGKEMDEKRAQWAAANQDRVRLHQSAYRERNRDDRLKKAREYRRENKEKFAARMREYRRRKPEVIRAIEARRVRSGEQKIRFNRYRREWGRQNRQKTQEYAHKRSGIRLARLPAGTVAKIGSMQKWRCAVCRDSIRRGRYHKDHIVSLANGGEHAPHNIQLLCPTCNLKKGAKHPIDFMQSRGFLL